MREFVYRSCVTFLLFVMTGMAAAAVPDTVSYQGRLTDPSGNPLNGTVSITFSVYDADTGGVALWTESQSVVLQNSIFTVALGSQTPFPAGLFSGGPRYLGISAGNDPEMTPRDQIHSSPFSIKAAEADTVSDPNVMLLNSSQSITGTKTFNPAGSAPFEVAGGKTATVTNLNADLLDGQHASDIITAAADEKRTAITSLPYTISTAGSYYLTGNLTSTYNGITLNADNVTIDLNGFTITGLGASAYNGIVITGWSNVEVRNGTIKGFVQYGISEMSIVGQTARGNRFINLRAVGNGMTGMRILGNQALVKDCSASTNGYHGLGISGQGTIVTGNTADSNTLGGVYASSCSGCTIAGNTASANGNNGIEAGEGNTVTGNTAYGNTWNGINASSGCTVTGNTASSNGQTGILVSQGGNVIGNTSYNNQWNGIQLVSYNFVDRNTSYNNKRAGGSYMNMTPASSCGLCVYGTNLAP